MKIFNADFNSDGLLDLLVIYNGGYKVFFNNGGEDGSLKFSDANSVVGTNLGNCYRMLPGDFDGDGRTDFLYYDSGHDFNIAFNNGDGTFTLKKQAFSLNDINKDTRKDNDRFTILLNDINRDGKTDILISKAKYEYERYSKKTYVKWLFYDGNSFSVAKELITDKKDDAKSGRLFIGDFDGDGAFEIANYGSNLCDETDKQTDILRVYAVNGNMSEFGKLVSITDGFGNTTSVRYSSASDVKVYKNGEYNKWYTKHLTLPVSLVSGVSKSNGSAGVQTLQYNYGGLKVNTCGKGLLGFTTMTIENKTLQTKENTVLGDWDEGRTWLPLTKTVTRTVGNETSVTVAKTAVVSVDNNYFAYTSEQDITDLDGNKLHVATDYDTENGVPTEEVASTENGAMYKKVRYMGYVRKSNMWMPTMMERIQKHKDDRNPFVSETVYTYDDKGNVLSCIENYGTPLSLHTESTYDVYGNVLTSEKSGIGVGKNIETNVYDASGRFVVKATESATSSVNTFAYDVWGNVLSDNDETVPDAILTTTHVYDDWGMETSVTDPFGNVSTVQTGWGTDKEKKYYVMHSPANKPWTRTWYDEAGNETLVESVGLNDVSVSKRTRYNNKGQVESVING